MTAPSFQKNIRLQTIILVAGLLIMGVKFLAWLLTNSNAILTDALESIINVIAGGFGLFSLFLAAKPRDLNHPYGHGKIEFISAGFEGGLIFLAGIIIIAKSVYNLFYPQAIQELDTGIVLVGVSGALNYLMGWMLVRQGRHTRSLIMQASGRHLQSDAYSSAGLILGLGIVFLTGVVWLDNVLAIFFGLIILFTGFRLARTSVAGIMDEADYQLIHQLVEQVRDIRSPNWIDVHNFRVIQYGATLHIDCHLTVPYYFDVIQAHHQIKSFEQAIAANSGIPVELFIHTDPCRPPRSCEICRKTDCPVRQAAFKDAIPWTLDNFMKNQHHLYQSDKSQSAN